MFYAEIYVLGSHGMKIFCRDGNISYFKIYSCSLQKIMKLLIIEQTESWSICSEKDLIYFWLSLLLPRDSSQLCTMYVKIDIPRRKKAKSIN